jgi:hypothetical protein
MYNGHHGDRHNADDPNHLQPARRVRSELENRSIERLIELEAEVRAFLTALPLDTDQRSKAQALTKLDEMVLWAKRGIDR